MSEKNKTYKTYKTYIGLTIDIKTVETMDKIKGSKSRSKYVEQALKEYIEKKDVEQVN